MNMNILEQEDLVKGAPDDLLLQEAQSPSGQLPQFLVVSEIQRRKQMRDRFSAQEQQPEQTVSDQIIAEAAPQMPPQGIGALQPQMQQQIPPQMQPQMPPQAPVVAMQPPEAMQQPSMPPEMMASQMDAQSQMMAAAGGRMPYRRMAGGGMLPNALVEDQSKFKGSLDEIPEDQEGFLSPEDMGIPKIIRSRNQQEEVPLYERAKGFVSNLRDNAEIGDFKVRGDSLTARGNVQFPVFGNALNLGAKGYMSTGSDGAGITELDASYAVPNKNLSLQGSYRPGDKSWQAGFLKRFNQGGVVKMQEAGAVPFVSMHDSGFKPQVPLRNYTPEEIASMSEEEMGAYNESVLDLIESKELTPPPREIGQNLRFGRKTYPYDMEDSPRSDRENLDMKYIWEKINRDINNVDTEDQNNPAYSRDYLAALAGQIPSLEFYGNKPAAEEAASQAGNVRRSPDVLSLRRPYEPAYVQQRQQDELMPDEPTEDRSLSVQRLLEELEGYKKEDITQVDYSDLIKSSQESSSKDAISRAYINLGAGIARGDIASGLEKAGQAVADVQDRQSDLNQALELSQRGALTEAETAKLTRNIGITEKQLSTLQDIASTKAELIAAQETSGLTAAMRIRLEKILDLQNTQGMSYTQAVEIVDGYSSASTNPKTGAVQVTSLVDGEWTVTELPLSPNKESNPMVTDVLGTEPGQTLFDLAEYASGPVSGVKALIAYPAAWAGKDFAQKEIAARQIFLNSSQDLIRSLAINDRFAVQEQERIMDFVSMAPSFLMSPVLLRNRMIGVKQALEVKLQQDIADGENTELPDDQRRASKRSAVAVRNFLSIMGEPTLAEDYVASDSDAGQPSKAYLDAGQDPALWPFMSENDRNRTWLKN